MGNSTLIQLFTNVSYFGSALFIPVIARDWGASPFKIGILVSVFYFTYFISAYVFGVLADRYSVRTVVRAGLLASTFFFFIQIFARDLSSLFWLRALAGAAAGVFPGALAVYAFEERQGKMGRFTAFSSLGWAIGSMLAGLIGSYNLIFIMSSVFFLISFVISLSLKDICSKNQGSFFPWRFFKKNLRIFFPYFMRALGAHTIWAIFPLYLMSLGADKFWVGIIYFINAFTQFFIMQYIENYKNLYLFNMGLLTTVITFLAYSFMPNFWWVIPVQVLLAFSFSALQVGAYQELLVKNPEKATATGVLTSIINFTAMVGPIAAGIILGLWNFPVLMWFAAGAAFIGLISFTKVIKY